MKLHHSTSKELVLITLISLGTMFILSCNRSGQDQAAPSAETKTKAAAAETTAPTAAERFAGWVEYGSQPHRFTIMTPKSFVVSRDTTQTPAGDIELVTYLAELGPAAYGVVCNDFPQDFVAGKDPNAILQGGSKGFNSQFNGTVTGEQLLTLNGHSGLEITLTGATQGVEIFAKGRFYLVGNRMYQIMVIAEKGKGDLEAIDKFLGSFKLKN
jgi:hypothetical protein